MELDVPVLLERAGKMAAACEHTVPPQENPGVALGLVLGCATSEGLDKLTLVTSPRFSSLGIWLEQLLAESTGKGGVGLIPVDQEPLGAPEEYGPDRLFLYVRDRLQPDDHQERCFARLRAAGLPIVEVEVTDPTELWAEFYRWEVATAVCGAQLGVNPFDQPDVEASKVAARARAESTIDGGPTTEVAALATPWASFFPDPTVARHGATPPTSARTLLAEHLAHVRARDYVGLLAFVPADSRLQEQFQSIRKRIRRKFFVATTSGFGPRYLHSTGQAHKGGPPTGVFILITCDAPEDIEVPDLGMSFQTIEHSQALGDLQILRERSRPTLRVHLHGDLVEALDSLDQLVEEVCRTP
jgi:hypothetical protein